MRQRKRVGIYGGTFDPPHNAHLILARFALKRLELDQLYIVPAKGHALKQNDLISPPAVRLEMVKAAFGRQKRIRVSRIELDGPEISYTVDTIERLKKHQTGADVEYFYLIGADNLQELHQWKTPERIFKIARVIVLRRPGYRINSDAHAYGERIEIIDSPEIDISSTEIRHRIRNGEAVDRFVPAPVLALIRKYQLYLTN